MTIRVLSLQDIQDGEACFDPPLSASQDKLVFAPSTASTTIYHHVDGPDRTLTPSLELMPFIRITPEQGPDIIALRGHMNMTDETQVETVAAARAFFLIKSVESVRYLSLVALPEWKSVKLAPENYSLPIALLPPCYGKC
jgi:hypothetical protein